MGTYLSTPITDKCEESGESLECPEVPCVWGVVDMQGWRKSMEDAHLAVTDIPLPLEQGDTHHADAKVFGVFDGHGGPEVARFCGLYLISVLTQQKTWKEGVPTICTAETTDGAESKVGKALRSTFHAIDRMIDDPNRREEIVNLRNVIPQTGERRDAINIPDAVEADVKPAEGVSVAATSNESEMVQEEAKSADEPVKMDETNGKPASSEEDNTVNDMKEDTSGNNKADDDSNEAVGKEEAAQQDQDMMDNDAESEVVALEQEEKPAKVTSMFQKILSLGSQGGQMVIGGDSEESSQEKLVPAAPPTGPSAAHPTVMHNGRMICNLPDHPIHAGATAIVAVVTGQTLTVANAGDSRAVLCRAGGTTFALSYDHKPQQDREMNRITKAGGFVNHFGRVNGNLNLSRSIGDLKYKQVPGIPPPGQMITAEPDIIQIALKPDDEFIILGCDGIWDCLTNENAVQYVHERIDTKTPTEIGTEMLDQIISEDPRMTQGIGGDNMTIMVIDLQPTSRKGRPSPEAPSSAD